MIWMLPLAGAAAGALLNKKNPLQGAMMGGALGATGGLLAPSALGASAAGAGAAGAGTAGGLGAAGLPLAEQVGAAGGAAGGWGTGGGLLNTMGAYAKPAMTAMQAAQIGKGLLGGDRPMQPMMPPQNNSAQGAQIMAELYKGGRPGMTPEQQMRMQRRNTMWG